MLFGQTGLLSFGHAMFFGFAAYVTGHAAKVWGLPPEVAALTVIVPYNDAGALEAIFSTLAIRDGKLPPTINQEVADPECDLDYIPNESREADVRTSVSNSFGFGGHNATIVVRRFED